RSGEAAPATRSAPARRRAAGVSCLAVGWKRRASIRPSLPGFDLPAFQIRRRTPLPGVTAAATTAVFATGEGPGETAFATTAVLATGWPITPTRPTRAALSGISGSF